MLFTCSHASSEDKEASAPKITNIDLKAEVVFTNSNLTVKNLDSFDWSNCKIKINYGILSDGYRISDISIKAGAKQSFELKSFTNSDSHRFNPNLIAFEKVNIFCNMDGKLGNYFGMFSN